MVHHVGIQRLGIEDLLALQLADNRDGGGLVPRAVGGCPVNSDLMLVNAFRANLAKITVGLRGGGIDRIVNELVADAVDGEVKVLRFPDEVGGIEGVEVHVERAKRTVGIPGFDGGGVNLVRLQAGIGDALVAGRAGDHQAGGHVRPVEEHLDIGDGVVARRAGVE